jgi:hypothetical protein
MAISSAFQHHAASWHPLFETVPFGQNESPRGVSFLVNGKRPVALQGEDPPGWNVAAPRRSFAENVFCSGISPAPSSERSRISRDLRDSILQTAAPLKFSWTFCRVVMRISDRRSDLRLMPAGLQQTVRNESAELRHFVTDLRPVRVQSADLVDLMRGFAERYRNESSLALDLLLDSADLRAPDRVCREVFQIYREALNNIKKHAKATHVVVKLSQDDSRLLLVVDDNGEGFSFAGKFTGDELDRLRLGPISIKERTRTQRGFESMAGIFEASAGVTGFRNCTYMP